MSYSYSVQDMFPRFVLQPKKSSYTYLDLSAKLFPNCCNTCFLEDEGWDGIMVRTTDYSRPVSRNCLWKEIDSDFVEWMPLFETYSEIFGDQPHIDYLSFSVDETSQEVFDNFPFDKVRFSCMTIEHDACEYGPNFRDYTRWKLLNLGYTLVCADVVYPKYGEFEDWWVDLSRTDPSKVQKLTCANSMIDLISDTINYWWSYFD